MHPHARVQGEAIFRSCEGRHARDDQAIAFRDRSEVVPKCDGLMVGRIFLRILNRARRPRSPKSSTRMNRPIRWEKVYEVSPATPLAHTHQSRTIPQSLATLASGYRPPP
jgi:hypothetical protein